jgi:hypothetical protein
MVKIEFKINIIWVRLIILNFMYYIEDDMTDDVEKISLIIDMSHVN